MVKDTYQYISIAETVEDCIAIIKYKSSRPSMKLEVIALSLESLEYIRSQSKIRTSHIWDLLDMEALIHSAYLNSHSVATDFLNAFDSNDDKKYAMAMERLLAPDILFFQTVVFYVVEKLTLFFEKQKWVYLVPPVNSIFFSHAIRNHQKNMKRNFLFKSVSVQEFKKARIEIKFIRQIDRFLFFRIIVVLFYSILLRYLKDVMQVFLPYSLKRHMVINYFRERRASYDVLINGWGSDISRFLDYSRLKDVVINKTGLRIINAIWRPGKVVGFNTSDEISPKFSSYVVDEEISKGHTYGPKLSNFLLKQRFTCMVGYNRLFIRHALCFKKWVKRQKVVSLQNAYVLINTLYNLFFEYRQGFIYDRLAYFLFKKSKVNVYVGSDGDLAGMRASIITAKEMGIKNLSAHHSLQPLSYPETQYLSNTVLAHGERDKLTLAKSINSERIAVLGNRKVSISNKKQDFRLPVKIVVATRSWGGFWINLGSKQNEYDKELRKLLRLLSTPDRFQVVIKSHPNGDYHEYYSLIAKRYNNVTHIKKAWKDREVGFLDLCDILVCLGEVPSLFLNAMFLNIPVVFITKTMTKTQRYLNYDYEDSCAVVKDHEEAFEAINRLIGDEAYLKNILEKQHIFSSGYTAANPEERLLSLLPGNELKMEVFETRSSGLMLN
jgi:hypothetical protein